MQVALVTGGSEGFGRAVAAELAAHGWHVIVNGRRAAALEAAADAIAAAGGSITARRGDVGDPAHREALIEAAAVAGRLDLLVLNAGSLGPSPLPRLADAPLDELDATLRTNVVAQLGLVQRALPLLIASTGAVVAVTSDAAVEAYEGWGVYGASKAALEQLGNVLAVEQPSIRTYRFDPGDMRTQMHQDAFPGEDISDRPPPEAVAPALRRLIEQRPPSGRYRAADVTVPAA